MNRERFNWWCENINHIHKALNKGFKNTEKALALDTCAVLEYPFVDIELTIRDYDEEEDVLYYDYFCCVNRTGTEDGWESYDCVEFGETDPKEFTTVKELMEDMHNQLIKFCKEHNLKMY